MIVITGAAGFIGSYFVGKLNLTGFSNLILVDKYDDPVKEKNLNTKQFNSLIDRDDFFNWLRLNRRNVEIIFHLGARTDTIGMEPEIYRQLNLYYSQRLWQDCTEYNLPFVYASSAATYGNGEKGFSDDHRQICNLKPLNLYAWSKHDFDTWILNQRRTPDFWAGLKFFNVYGPNEYHKGMMASVIMQAFNRIKETGEMKLFRSDRADYKDGEQKRDFIYVDDIAEVMLFFMENQKNSGIYNVGTGKARSYLDLTKSVFDSMKLSPEIKFIDAPSELQGRYQYFTEADINKLREIGYSKQFTELEAGVSDYVSNYLENESCF